MKGAGFCMVSGCRCDAYSRGMCALHYSHRFHRKYAKYRLKAPKWPPISRQDASETTKTA